MASKNIVFLLMWICAVDPVRNFLLDDGGGVKCPGSVTSHQRYVRTYRDKCYEFVIYQKKYWGDARIDCLTKGGDLATIPDGYVQKFIMDSLVALGNREHGLWFGLTDKEHELHWKWVNGQSLRGYNNWAHAQGGANILHLTQDCAQIRTDDHGLWHDKECHLWPQKFAYICQYDGEIITTTSTSTTMKPTTTVTTTPAPTTSTTTTPSTTAPTTSTTQTTTTTTIPTTTSTVTTPSTTAPTTATTQTTTTTIPTTTTSTTMTSSSNTTLLSTILTSAAATKTVPSTVKLTTAAKTMTTKTTTAAATTKTTTTTTYKCREVNCSEQCHQGYSGVFVDLNGCIECNCN